MTNEEALEQIKALEQQCHNYMVQWEKLREQRDNARARVAYLEREVIIVRSEINVLRTEKAMEIK